MWKIVLVSLSCGLGLWGSGPGCTGHPAPTAVEKGSLDAASTPEESAVKQAQLRRLILDDRVLAAERLAREMGTGAHSVLAGLAVHEEPLVRKDVLEVAAELDDVNSGRLILAALDDPDEEVQELAASLVDVCAHEELVPAMMAAMERHPNPALRGALALQVGAVGNEAQIPILREYWQGAEDDALRHNLEMAMAKLGDGACRRRFIRDLEDLDAVRRHRALRDCLYIADPSLAAYFGPALEDYRDVVLLTVPEDPEIVYARMCDVAVYVMSGLGYSFTYDAESLQVRTPKELKEAVEVVARLNADWP